MKDILIITSYYPPETGAASNRISHLAEGLQKHDYKVSVLTPLPNYPTGKIFEGYKGILKKKSVENNVSVIRLWVYASNSKNKLLRLLSMLSYSFSLMWFFAFNKIPKTVIIQSPPLLVAFTSLFVLNSKKHKLILNVSDLWPIAGLELGAFKKNFSYKLLERIERYNYKKANLVLGQCEEILTHVKSLFPNKDTSLYRNFPDFKAPEIIELPSSSKKIKIVYAGLLGVAQGIYKLINNLDFTNIEFHIYGNGAERELIEVFILKNPELPIHYHGEVSRKELHKELSKYDIVIIPLLNRIYGSVPSKIFEYAKLGFPMLYFGGGEGEILVEKYKLGWIVKPGYYNHLNSTIRTLKKESLNIEYKKAIKKTALREFNFNEQLKALIEIL